MMRVAFSIALLVAACGGDDETTTADGHWQLLGSAQPSSLLAVWSSGLDNVWVVGGREGVGTGPAVWHFDGSAWTKLDTGLKDVDLWQVFGFADGTVFLGGSNGTILRYRAGTFEKLVTPSTDIVFGLWGSSSDDVWAVGGQTNGRGFVWRYRGTSFEAVSDLPTDLANGTVWKVTGRAADDVWMSCAGGLVMHWDGAALTSERISATAESLFSIGCDDTSCVTAGTNLSNGVLYQTEGQGWTSRVPTPDGPVWRGVTPVGPHRYVVGQFGAVLRLDGDAWRVDEQTLSQETLHAAWSDADGNVFAVGGKFDRAITTDGMLLFKGESDLRGL